MPSISVTFSPKVASDWDPQKPLTTTKLNQLFDNTTHLREWLGASYTAGAVQDHDHDGVNSAKVQIGPNMLRGGDFEGGLADWTSTIYTGGSIAASTLDADGTAAVQITSTVLANGGGDILSNEFMVVIGDAAYDWSVNNWASVANVSSKLEAVFYDAAQAAISTSVLLTNTSTPTTNTRTNGVVIVPATARYMQIRATGGIPATGSAVGTIYFDAIQCTFSNAQALAGTSNLSVIPTTRDNDGVTYIYTQPYELRIVGPYGTAEIFNSVVHISGTYSVAFSIKGTAGQIATGRIYKNGVAYGTSRTKTDATYTEYVEDLQFVAGDTVQLFGSMSSSSFYLKNFGFRVNSSLRNNLIPPTTLVIGKR